MPSAKKVAGTVPCITRSLYSVRKSVGQDCILSGQVTNLSYVLVAASWYRRGVRKEAAVSGCGH